MRFTTGSALSDNQDPLIITAVASGCRGAGGSAGREPAADWQACLQLAEECRAAGASVLHVDLPGSRAGPASLDAVQCNAALADLRRAVPQLLLQVDSTGFFAPHGVAQRARWLGADTRHMVAELDPKPDVVTVGIGTPAAPSPGPAIQVQRPPEAFEMKLLRRLRENDIQPCFLVQDVHALETLERMVRAGMHMGPLTCMVATADGQLGANPLDWMEFLRRAPEGAVVAFEGSYRVAPAIASVAVALGVHMRVGAGRDPAHPNGTARVVQQIKQVVRMADELGRKVATGDEARRIMKIGTWYDSTEETLFMLGLRPDRGRADVAN